MSFDDSSQVIQNYPVLPLKNVVLFPGNTRSLFFNRPYSLAALKAVRPDQLVFMVTLQQPERDRYVKEDLYEVGVLGKVLKVQRMPNGANQVLFRAISRGALTSLDYNGNFYNGRVQHLASRENADTELPLMVKALEGEFVKYMESGDKNKKVRLADGVDPHSMPAGHFADLVAPLIQCSTEEHQEILATLDTRERVEKIYALLLKEMKQKGFERELRARVEEQMNRRQKEFFLNEKMKAIQEELGDGEGDNEFDEIQKAIDAAQMPEHVREVAEKELLKLRRMGGNSHEATPVRNYLDWLTNLPWNQTTEDNLSLANVQSILDEDHYGLDKPKERIVEYIAVARAVGKLKGPILCLSGPPGVGKTSLARSIARALGRKFARISLGGVRDEAEIRGHRRTYIGALPGKLVQTMKKVKTTNPVLLLDEIDKISQHYNGGPVAAMLEVLDPEQNNAFMDHYLEVEYDLSNVLFICTANDLSTIPWPLRDRMEIIELSGYTELEKVKIARRYLLPKQMKENGLKRGQLRMGDKQILELIRGWTREAGVRGLERELAKVCRKAVTERLRSAKDKGISLSKTRMERYLGPNRFKHNAVENQNEVGMVTGLAWTSVGGETLSIEVTTMKGSGKTQLTGTLGDVMKESAQAAISYVRANANHLGIYSKVFKDMDIHIHVPAGGTPKDGPSAGIALTGGLVSALTGIPINWDVALTGEVTLRGNVLPIGGLKEKLLAARRANMRKVLIPNDNVKDLVEIPDEITNGLEISPVKHVSEVFPVLLERLPEEVNDDDLPEDTSPNLIENLDPSAGNPGLAG